MSRTFATSRIQRDVIQHHGHSGSNQKSATDFWGPSRAWRGPLVGVSSGEYTAQHNHGRPAPVPADPVKLDAVALPNLTRDQAVERAALITVDSYQIILDVTDGNGAPGERTFRSTTTVVFDALPGADTVIDISAHTVRRASLNDQDLDVSGYDEAAGIPLRGLAQRNVVVVDADCHYSNTGEGLHRFVDPVDGETYLYSQFETADAKRMFACFDQPDLKATFDVRVTAPAHWKVISNGAPLAAANGVHTFATTPRMSTYLVALIAGPYAA